MDIGTYSNHVQVAAAPSGEVTIIFSHETPVFGEDNSISGHRVEVSRIVMTTANANKLVKVIENCVQSASSDEPKGNA